MQGLFKDMNATCNILNIGQPVLQIMTFLSFVSRVLKNDMTVHVISAKVIVKNCIIIIIVVVVILYTSRTEMISSASFVMQHFDRL